MADESLNLPGFLGSDRVSPVYVDGIDVEAFAGAVQDNPFQAGQRTDQGLTFWSSPPRLAESAPVRDVFEVDLSGPRLINRLAFDLAHFPQDAAVEYSPDATSAWQPVLDLAGIALTHSIADSNPPVVQSVATASGGHPQHFGAGHWTSVDFVATPFTAARLRIVLTRPLGRIYPTNSQGALVAYSLGVRSFIVGYEVLTRDDIPTTDLRVGSHTEHVPFAGTRDLLGSSVAYAERETPAVNLLHGGIWRCEPQPVSNAVVPLYIDVSVDGAATVIERIYAEPLVSGVAVNLYYTADAATNGFDAVEWVPINRDFVLRRGFMRFDPVLARFIKMEFTNLAVEPYDAPGVIIREVRLFPSEMMSQHVEGRAGDAGGAGATVQSQFTTLMRYDDFFSRPGGATDLSAGYTPTEVFHSDDPSAAERLRNLSGFFNYTTWQGLRAPRWPTTQTHPYVVTEVAHTQRVAFYVGLAALSVYRLDYAFDDDTDAYLDYFYDDAQIAEMSDWEQTPGDLLSLSSSAQVTSKTLRSHTGIRAVQFATTQSPSVQLLPDDDFDSAQGGEEALAVNWGTFGINEAPATMTPDNVYNTDVGTTVLVTRDGTTDTDPVGTGPHTWAGIGNRYQRYGNIEAAGLTYADLSEPEGAPQNERMSGVINQTVVYPVLGTRLYAAARVISARALAEPLWLQIVDSTTHEILAEVGATIPANQVVEWELPYTAAADALLAGRTYAEVEGMGTYDDLEILTWDQVGSTATQTPVSIQVRLAQRGVPNASWNIDTLSLFEESILWEFSNDDGEHWYAAPAIRNNPNGVLVFPEPPLINDHTFDDLIGIQDSQATWDDLDGFTYDELEGTPQQDPPVRNLLRWRARCFRAGQHISALSIRPWYDYTLHGIPSVEGVNVVGSNLALYDQYQPISLDPRYRMWDRPVPRDWWYYYRQFVLQRHGVFVGTTAPQPQTVLNDVLVTNFTPV